MESFVLVVCLLLHPHWDNACLCASSRCTDESHLKDNNDAAGRPGSWFQAGGPDLAETVVSTGSALPMALWASRRGGDITWEGFCTAVARAAPHSLSPASSEGRLRTCGCCPRDTGRSRRRPSAGGGTAGEPGAAAGRGEPWVACEGTSPAGLSSWRHGRNRCQAEGGGAGASSPRGHPQGSSRRIRRAAAGEAGGCNMETGKRSDCWLLLLLLALSSFPPEGKRRVGKTGTGAAAADNAPTADSCWLWPGCCTRRRGGLRKGRPTAATARGSSCRRGSNSSGNYSTDSSCCKELRPHNSHGGDCTCVSEPPWERENCRSRLSPRGFSAWLARGRCGRRYTSQTPSQCASPTKEGSMPIDINCFTFPGLVRHRHTDVALIADTQRLQKRVRQT